MADEVSEARRVIRRAMAAVAGKTERANDLAALLMSDIRRGDSVDDDLLQRHPDLIYRKPGEIPTDLQGFVENMLAEYKARDANPATVTRLLKKRIDEHQQRERDLEEWDV